MEFIQFTEDAFSQLGGQYHSRKQSSEGTVCEWKWATWCWFELQPLYFERHGWAPGRMLRQGPEKLKHQVECGLDHAGRVAVQREYHGSGFAETFYDWNAKPIEVAHFNYEPEKKPITLLLVQLDRGRAIASFQSAVHGFTREDYIWSGSVVSKVDVHYAKRVQGVLDSLRPWHTARAQYDSKEVVQRVELVWPPDPPQRPNEIVELMFERRGNRIHRKRT